MASNRRTDTRRSVMRYSPTGADDIHDCVVMIYQACGLDKQKTEPLSVDKGSVFVAILRIKGVQQLKRRSIVFILLLVFYLFDKDDSE